MVRSGIAAAIVWATCGGFFVASGALAGDMPASPPAATDGDPAQRYAELDKQIGLHLKDKAVDALKLDVAEVAKEAKAATDPVWRTKLGALIGRILDGTTDDPTQKVALVAIGDSADPALFRFLRRWLAQPNPKEEPPLLAEAITAAGKLVSSDAVQPLLTIVQKSKLYPLATAAMEALANYGPNKRMRVKILTEIISTVSKDSPGVGNRWDSSSGEAQATARTKTGEESRARWGALSGVMVVCLNRMTGTNCATAEDWFGLYDKYKSRLDALFVKE